MRFFFPHRDIKFLVTFINHKMAGLINFEDEQEVKQFLDNLGVEYSYQCYREKDPEGKSVAIHGCCPQHGVLNGKLGNC